MKSLCNKSLITFCSFLIFISCCKGQNKVDTTRKVYTIVEQMPQFVGGENEMFFFIQKNINYPREARFNDITGKVYVTFVVDTDGTIINTKVLKGIGSGCDEEAIRVVKSMPAWIAGKQNGHNVAVQYTVPISFNIVHYDRNGKVIPHK